MKRAGSLMRAIQLERGGGTAARRCAVLERLNREDLTTTLIPFNLGKVVLEGDAVHNLPLEAVDVVTVFSKSDVRAPAQRRSVVVQLEGELNHAGVYQALQGETLRQLVMRVGGVTEQAYLFGTQFTRESTKKAQEERLRQAIVKQDGEWWIGWIEEVPGVNCQEGTREELLKTLRVTLAEALQMNRTDAREAAGKGYEELSIAV